MDRITIPTSPPPLARRAVLCALTTVALCTCGAVAPGSPASPPPTPSAAAVSLTVSEPDNHTTVGAVVGEQLTLVLHSTYWRVEGSADASVVTPVGAAQVTPILNGCVAGAGCGTVSMRFVARAPGTASLSATRSVCGEALRCDAIQLYLVTVVVSSQP